MMKGTSLSTDHEAVEISIALGPGSLTVAEDLFDNMPNLPGEAGIAGIDPFSTIS
jgi:hypothetical protein